MQDKQQNLDLVGLSMAPDDTDPRQTSGLIRDLVNRIEQLEEQNAALRKALEAINAVPSLVPHAQAPRHAPPPAADAHRRSPLEPPRTKQAPRPSRRARHQNSPTPQKSPQKSPQQQSPQPIANDGTEQADDLRRRFAADKDAGDLKVMKRSGPVRSRFRRQFRYFTMTRLHAILAGLCLSTGAIASAVGNMLDIWILCTGGIIIAAIGAIYMIVVGFFWVFGKLAMAEEETDVVLIENAIPQRHTQSILSHGIYWLSRLFMK
ncbi:MAG: hypothetical protein OSB41_05735 [Kiritimatiellae bacterium]|nr:hypothetical protein [Kiritimatiellia bacterium]